MTKVLYAAMRYALDDEIRNQPEETEMLRVFLDAFVDNPNDFEKYTPEQREEIYQKVRLVSPAIKTKSMTRREASKEWVALMVGAAVISGAAIAATSLWALKKHK